MVLALLREAREPGTGKTQTRRTLKSARTINLPEMPAYTLKGDALARALLEADDFINIDGNLWQWTAKAFDYQIAARTVWAARLGFAKGDRLWVRETCWILGRWRKDGRTSTGRQKWRFVEDSARKVLFEAPVPEPKKRTATAYWRRNSIHMPRWALRLTLTVTDVRVERLQAISVDAAAAEGLKYIDEGPGAGFWVVDDTPVCGDGSVEAYAQLWDHINGAGAWKADPWIVATTFTVALRNIDAGETT
jgi:hypothetical protein